ncbi:hypothetical protein C8J57DRAFT_1527811 [Mycena rebaudengoi]|nr:hypothetical protein C8J57DRAFT_1527811 [Mycena rebaudengoi]
MLCTASALKMRRIVVPCCLLTWPRIKAVLLAASHHLSPPPEPCITPTHMAAGVPMSFLPLHASADASPSLRRKLEDEDTADAEDAEHPHKLPAHGTGFRSRPLQANSVASTSRVHLHYGCDYGHGLNTSTTTSHG